MQFREVFLTPDFLGIAMEYAAGGDMFQHVTTKRGLSEDEARWFFQQLVLGLDYCHKMVGRLLLPLPNFYKRMWCCSHVLQKLELPAHRVNICEAVCCVCAAFLYSVEKSFFRKSIVGVQGIVNRDIKLENTLLDGSKRPLLKICDFGYSKHEKDSLPKSKVGTPGYTGGICTVRCFPRMHKSLLLLFPMCSVLWPTCLASDFHCGTCAAPEVISNRKHYDGKQADVWSAGDLGLSLHDAECRPGCACLHNQGKCKWVCGFNADGTLGSSQESCSMSCFSASKSYLTKFRGCSMPLCCKLHGCLKPCRVIHMVAGRMVRGVHLAHAGTHSSGHRTGTTTSGSRRSCSAFLELTTASRPA